MKSKPYHLPFRERRRLQGRAYRAQQRAQSEVCGVLLATADRRLQLYFLTNRSQQPGAWKLYASDISAVRRRLARTGMRVVGTFHSHPITEPVPGPRDFASIRVGQLQLIYDVCGRATRLWTRGSQKAGATPIEVALRLIGRSPNEPYRPISPKCL